MIDRHRNSLLQQHATQDIKLKGLFVQKPSSANQVRQAIAQAHPLTTQVGQVRLFASALNPYLNYINTVYQCLYLNTFVHICSNYCQPLAAVAYANQLLFESEARAKRVPSSLVHTTTSSGASVTMPTSLSVRSTSRPA